MVGKCKRKRWLARPRPSCSQLKLLALTSNFSSQIASGDRRGRRSHCKLSLLLILYLHLHIIIQRECVALLVVRCFALFPTGFRWGAPPAARKRMHKTSATFTRTKICIRAQLFFSWTKILYLLSALNTHTEEMGESTNVRVTLFFQALHNSPMKLINFYPNKTNHPLLAR